MSANSEPKYEPFLLRFAQPCQSPGRFIKPNPEYFYDHETSLVRWSNGADNPPAVIQSGAQPPQTKKADIEKGEDAKDRRMWR